MYGKTSLEVRTANVGVSGIVPRAANRRNFDYPLSDRLRPQDRSDIQDFLHHLATKGRSAKTHRTYAQAAEALALFAGAKGMPLLADMRREHIEDFIASMWEKGNKPATVRNRYASLQQLFRWMQRDDVRTDNPMERIAAPQIPEQIQPDYGPEQVSALLDSIKPKMLIDFRDRAIIALLFDCGMRAQELSDILVGDVERDARRIEIVAGKGGKGRQVAYSHQTALILNKYIRRCGGWESLDRTAPLLAAREGAPMNPNSLRLMMVKRFRAAGLDFRGLHAFRRGWGQSYLGNGGSPLDLKQLGGWKSMNLVHRYTQRTAQERALATADEFSPMARLGSRDR